MNRADRAREKALRLRIKRIDDDIKAIRRRLKEGNDQARRLSGLARKEPTWLDSGKRNQNKHD